MRKGIEDYIADKGKHFVLTEKGAKAKSHEELGVGGVVDIWEHYAPHRVIEDGTLIEVDDPDWVVLPGFKVVRNYKGTELCCGNPIVFHDKEMAERYKEHYENLYKSWRDDAVPYIVEALYEGKRPKPNREYNGKTLYIQENWFCDIGKIGDLVEENIAMEIANCVPPRTFTRNMIQCGEPASSAKEGATYATFVRVDDDVWEYKGNCLAGHTEEDWTSIPYLV